MPRGALKKSKSRINMFIDDGWRSWRFVTFPMSYISKMMTKESYGNSHMNRLHVLDVNKKGCNKREKNAMYADVYHRLII